MPKTKKRFKPTTKMAAVRNLDEANEALLEIARRRIELRRIDADAEDAINAIKEEANEKASPIQKEIEHFEKGLAAYAEMSRDDIFTEKKSIELNFGIMGYRKSTRISVSRKHTLDLLKKHGLTEAIKVKETPNKDVLADYPEETLKKVKAKRVSDDKFWYEVKEEEVTQKGKSGDK